MADNTINLQTTQSVNATATVDELASRWNAAKKVLDARKKEMKRYKDLVASKKVGTEPYKNALMFVDSTRKQVQEAQAAFDEIDVQYKAVKRQKKSAESASSLQDKLAQANDAVAKLEKEKAEKLRRAKDLKYTSETIQKITDTYNAKIDSAKTRAESAKTAVANAGMPGGVSTPAEATAVGPMAPSVQPSFGNGYDYTHGKQFTSEQVLWKEGNDWVVKNQADFIGPGGQVKTEYIPQIRQALKDAGYRDAKSLVDLTNNWRNLVLSTGGQYSPLEASKWSAEFLGAAGGAGGAGGGGGFTTQYYKTIQTPQGLRSDIDKIYQATLGRDATWKEVVEATDFVNSQIDKDPYKRKTTAAGVTESGLTKEAAMSMLIQGLKKNPEYAEQVGQNFETWVEQKTGLKFADIASDPGLDAALRLYKAGNEVDALRALKNTATIKGVEGSKLAGETATAKDTLAKYANAMGVAFDVQSAADAIAKGLATDADYKNQIKELAKSYYPSWAKQIDAGQTMESIAYPYLNSMATILELNPADVNVNDPAIKRALTYRDKDGNATSQSIWDFEQSLRQDPRWGYTKNARTELDSVARSVLRDFGLAY